MRKNQGFTLIEIVVGIIIIAVLLVALLSFLGHFMREAREDARQAKYVEVQDMVNKEYLRLSLTSDSIQCFEDYTQALLNVAQGGVSQPVGTGYTFTLTVQTTLMRYWSYDDQDGLTGAKWSPIEGASGSKYRNQATDTTLLVNGEPVYGKLLLPKQFCETF